MQQETPLLELLPCIGSMQNSTQPTRNTLNLSTFHGKLQQETPLITGTATTPLRRLTDRAGAAARTRESRAAGSTIERHDAKAMNGRCSETADAQANHSPTRFQVWPFLLRST